MSPLYLVSLSYDQFPEKIKVVDYRVSDALGDEFELVEDVILRVKTTKQSEPQR